jgi:hypothetical protein
MILWPTNHAVNIDILQQTLLCVLCQQAHATASIWKLVKKNLFARFSYIYQMLLPGYALLHFKEFDEVGINTKKRGLLFPTGGYDISYEIWRNIRVLRSGRSAYLERILPDC